MVQRRASVSEVVPVAVTEGDRSAAERALVAQVCAGAPDAFETLFRTYRTALTRVAARYTPSRAIADEVVQDIFLSIWRGRTTWNPGAHLAAYLFAMTRNAAMNAARRGRLEARWVMPLETRDGNAAAIVDHQRGADAMVEASDRATALATAAQSLSPRVREAFLLRWRDGLSYAEIAQVTSVSIKTVEKQLGIAFKVMRTTLAPWIDQP